MAIREVFRKPSLIFWKLQPPNLISRLVPVPGRHLKSVCEQRLSENGKLLGRHSGIGAPHVAF